MSEKMRAEFELLASNLLLPMDKHDGNYVHTGVNRRWQAWQASRASLVVEFPQIPYCAQGMANPSYSEALDDCKRSIDLVGVSYK